MVIALIACAGARQDSVRSYHERLQRRGIEAHVSIREGPISLETDEGVTRWLCRRPSGREAFRKKQRRRKIAEQAFSWFKALAGLGRTRLVGRWKIRMQVTMAVAAYNQLRLAKPAPAWRA